MGACAVGLAAAQNIYKLEGPPGPLLLREHPCILWLHVSRLQLLHGRVKMVPLAVSTAAPLSAAAKQGSAPSASGSTWTQGGPL